MIDENKIPQEIKDLAKRLANKGANLFLVGGSVRDIYLGIQPNEYDFEIFADEDLKKGYLNLNADERKNLRREFIERILAELNSIGIIKKTGKSFGVFKIVGKPYDFSFPRKEIKVGETRKDYDIMLDPFMDFRDAQKRRDLTINSLLYSIESKIIIDNFGGIKDLEAGIIRHVDPLTFIEDPLRVYRIAQFVSRFGFKVSEETILLCSKVDFEKLSTERIHWELEKLFSGDYIFDGINFLKIARVLFKKHPELDDLMGKQELQISKEAISKIDHEGNLTQKLTLFFVIFLKKLNSKEFIETVSSILDSFTNSKKLKSKVINNLKAIIITVDYYNEKISLARTVIILKEKITMQALIIFLKFYDDLFIDKNEGFMKDMYRLKNIVDDFSPEIKGEDLEEIGIYPSEEYKDLLFYAVELQLRGVKKKEILEEIARLTKK